MNAFSRLVAAFFPKLEKPASEALPAEQPRRRRRAKQRALKARAKRGMILVRRGDW